MFKSNINYETLLLNKDYYRKQYRLTRGSHDPFTLLVIHAQFVFNCLVLREKNILPSISDFKKSQTLWPLVPFGSIISQTQ